MMERLSNPNMGELEEDWSDPYTIEEMSNGDFERRSNGIGIRDTKGKLRPLIDHLKDEWGMNDSKTIDKALRIYIAHLSNENSLDIRDEFNVVTMIPSAEWVEDFERFDVDVGDGDYEKYYSSTTPTVMEMVDWLIENDYGENRSDVAISAVCWISNND